MRQTSFLVFYIRDELVYLSSLWWPPLVWGSSLNWPSSLLENFSGYIKCRQLLNPVRSRIDKVSLQWHHLSCPSGVLAVQSKQCLHARLLLILTCLGYLSVFWVLVMLSLLCSVFFIRWSLAPVLCMHIRALGAVGKTNWIGDFLSRTFHPWDSTTSMKA